MSGFANCSNITCSDTNCSDTNCLVNICSTKTESKEQIHCIELSSQHRILTLNTFGNVKIYIKYKINTLSLNGIKHFLSNILKYSYNGSSNISDFDFKIIDESNEFVIPSCSDDAGMSESDYDIYSKLLIDLVASEDKTLYMVMKNFDDSFAIQSKWDDIKHKFEGNDLTTFYLKSLNGKTIPVSCHIDETFISDLKIYIAQIEGIPIDNQRFIFNGKQLENKYSLEYYKIVKDCSLHLILRLRGGMFNEASGRDGGYQPLKSVFYDMDINEFI